MNNNRSHVPIINLNLDEAFTENANQLLRELLQLFIEETPGIQQKINAAFHSKEKEKLQELLHKLLGSCIYCGLARLKESLIDLKKSTSKNNYSMELLHDFNKELEKALEEAHKI